MTLEYLRSTDTEKIQLSLSDTYMPGTQLPVCPQRVNKKEVFNYEGDRNTVMTLSQHGAKKD